MIINEPENNIQNNNGLVTNTGVVVLVIGKKNLAALKMIFLDKSPNVNLLTKSGAGPTGKWINLEWDLVTGD